MKKLFFAAAALLLIGTAGCYNDKYDQLYVTPATVTCDTTAVSYSTTVAPIINANCNVSGGCHDAAGAATSGYNFSTYAGVQAVANYDYMITDITGNPTSRHHAMPLNLPKISQCDINIITAWIDQGALNN
jgi:mono/diheme cytochrome c family protein